MQRHNSLSGVLGALAVFESAARLGSFTKASLELGLTQPAFSKRIAALEDRLRIDLFERNHNKLELTADGLHLLKAVEVSLEHLDSVVSRLIQKLDGQTLTIACGFSFLSMWLQPRFSKRRRVLVNVELRLIASEHSEAMDPKQIDIRILWGNNHWPGRETLLLLPDIVFPVCSPSFMHETGNAAGSELAPDAFLSQPLLYSPTSGSNRSNWEEWFHAWQVRFVPDGNRYV